MKQRILLVSSRGVSPARKQLRIQPPTGLAYIASKLMIEGHEVDILDARAEGFSNVHETDNVRVTGLSDSALFERIRSFEPDIIGITYGVMSDHEQIRELVTTLRGEVGKELPLILGGVNATIMQRKIMGETGYPVETIPGIDFVVSGLGIGSAENTIVKLVSALALGNKYPFGVPGIAFFDRSGTLICNPQPPIDIENLPKPARQLFKKDGDLDIYSRINNTHAGPLEEDELPFAVIFTTNGCKYRCRFCAAPTLYLRRALSDISDEISQLNEQGVKTVMIDDDNFGGHSSQDISEACRIIEKLAGFNVVFSNGLAIYSLITENFKLLDALKRLPKVRIFFPIESGSERTLRMMRKPHTLEQVRRVLEYKRRNLDNVSFEAPAIIGFDGETREDIRKTLEFLKWAIDNGLDSAVMLCYTPLPPTEGYKRWRAQNPDAQFSKLHFSMPSGAWQPSGFLQEVMLEFEEFLASVGKTANRRVI